jgi:ribosomal protein S18 acetylase RimI-like enzyme
VDLSWCTLTRADAPAMSDVYSAAALADGTGDLRSSADMAEVFVREGLGGVRRRYFGVFDAGGGLVAFAVLFARTALLPQHQLHLWGAVDPKHRRAGIGGELVRRAVAAAPALHAEVFPGAPLEVMFAATDGVPGQARLAAAAGFEPWRRNLAMRRELAPGAPPARPLVPDGLALRRFEPADEHDLLAAHLDSFVPDHPGITPPTPVMWSRRLRALSFLPDLSFLMYEPAAGRIAGYVLSNLTPRQPDRPERREVNLTTIATCRAYRRRGVAAGVIAAVLRGAAEFGYDAASLSVDAHNPSGALSVYARAGFQTCGGVTMYVRPLSQLARS